MRRKITPLDIAIKKGYTVISDALRRHRVSMITLRVIARSAYSVPLAHQEPASVRPYVLRPHRSAKSTKNGPPETDLANSIAGRGVPFFVHFWDLTQIRQLTQSDSIIPILYVDDKKKPQNGLFKASRPPPCGCCLVKLEIPVIVSFSKCTIVKKQW